MHRKILVLGLIIMSSFFSQGQTVLTGQITDSESNEPLVGATAVTNKKKYAITDEYGKFSVEATVGDSLKISFIGYDTKQIQVTNLSNLKIKLTATSSDLNDIVVIGYGTKKRKDLTGSVSSIKTKDIDKKSFARVENALQGKAAGVQVTQFSGKPGNPMSVRVRGATSLSAGNEPLYVVDGVPVLSTEGLNPADIASLEILKDASATAIYGARAANGVVLITTKRGSSKQSAITVSSSFGISQVQKTLPVLNSKDYVDLINESYVNAGQSPILSAEDYTENTDWQNEIFRNALTSDLQLSFSGGADKTTYFVSASRNNQEGIVRESDFERFNFRSNFDTEVRKGVKIGTNLSLARINFNNVPDNNRVNQGGVILGALSTPPIIGIYNEDGTYATNPLQAWENPIANIEAPMDVAATTRFVGNVYVDIDIIENLTFRSSLGTETYYNKNDYFLDPARTQFGRSLEGLATVNTNREFIWLSENTLKYDLRRNNHNWTFLGGITAQKSSYESTFSRAEGFSNGSIPTLNAGSRKIEASSFASQWGLFSYLGRTSYRFKNKYMADLNMRADGSSRFGAGNRFAFFPSVSAAWRISEEKFFEDVERVDDLKLRASIGRTGNQNIGDFTAIGLYATDANYIYNNLIVPGTRPATIGNSELKWETTNQLDIGLDVSMFHNRIKVTADYYNKRTTDLLINVDLPRSTGFTSGIQNLGEVRNYGWELAVQSTNIRRQNFNWSTQFNISQNRNIVLDIGGEDNIIFAGNIPESGAAVIVQEGLPLGSFYGFRSLGVNPDDGNIVFEDLNGDNLITDDDRTVIGDANPDYILGLTNTVSYGNFTLDVLVQSSIGNEVLNATRIETEGMSSVKNASITTLDRWQNPGDITRIPVATFGDPNGNNRISDRFIEDGSFVRIRNLTLSYDLPSNQLARLKIKNASVFITIQNLWVWSRYSGFDPEVNRDGGSAISQGIDYGTYPQPRMYMGGLRITL